MWDGHDGMGWWMLFGGLLWIVFILAIVFITARVAGGTGGSGGSTTRSHLPSNETPLEIARRRDAAGEISREEFEQIRRDLG